MRLCRRPIPVLVMGVLWGSRYFLFSRCLEYNISCRPNAFGSRTIRLHGPTIHCTQTEQYLMDSVHDVRVSKKNDSFAPNHILLVGHTPSMYASCRISDLHPWAYPMNVRVSSDIRFAPMGSRFLIGRCPDTSTGP